MTTKSIFWGLGDKGVGFYKMAKALDNVIIGEANLMITFGKLMNGLNNNLSSVSLKLQDITKNLNMLNKLDKVISKTGMLSMIASFGLMGLSSMAAETEVTEETSAFKKVATKCNQGAQGLGSAKMQFLLGSLKSSIGAGVIISCLQAYFSANTGIDNSQISKFKALSDGEQEGSKQIANSESKSSQTIQSITRAEQKAIQNDYNSKTHALYYNN
ncbi:MAG: hypothetical protein K940chlam5_00138 [Candidatus Anoxychlamydiales bacterium]|nr:hypothetical protein [Candidatus Anoxychlamydiales bacterium]